ncbi:MAG: monofunctional biosynthetic peptidoglycan transglycosylase [Chitinophagaceae bacterium]|nr:monofunctional biosynthetic peptidoglycan transglycosylase [Chitinophagaceae bacterium]
MQKQNDSPSPSFWIFFKKLIRLLRNIFIWLFFFHLFYIVILRWVNPPITLTQLSNWLKGYGLKRDYVSRKNISPYARLAVIASEDQLFPDHYGFDWKSIKKAMEYNKRKPGRIRGGSTISQQVAKNVFLWQGRSWIRKGLEAYFTFMIEFFWSKERILEVYLNVIETGKGIFGIEAAAQTYFKKPAKLLTAEESAMIAACLPNPKEYKVKPPSSWVQFRSRQILVQMNNLRTDPDIIRITGFQ